MQCEGFQHILLGFVECAHDTREVEVTNKEQTTAAVGRFTAGIEQLLFDDEMQLCTDGRRKVPKSSVGGAFGVCAANRIIVFPVLVGTAHSCQSRAIRRA
ncbi:hypothetical protein HBI82_070320 [Parastagonospora nodorum]|nr:hypothetical protein HBH72_092420 [Parastagonospora nodorum]KAH6023985.1 hypothetical protein HBI82_070320 [Parastagonospora nodorum]